MLSVVPQVHASESNEAVVLSAIPTGQIPSLSRRFPQGTRRSKDFIGGSASVWQISPGGIVGPRFTEDH